jgi:hypothetical protein
MLLQRAPVTQAYNRHIEMIDAECLRLVGQCEDLYFDEGTSYRVCEELDINSSGIRHVFSTTSTPDLRDILNGIELNSRIAFVKKYIEHARKLLHV